MILAPTYVRILVVLLLAATTWGVWGEIRASNLRAEVAEGRSALQAEKRDRAEKLAEGVEKARKQDLATITAQQEALDYATTQARELQRDVDRLRAATGSLRNELAKIRDTASAAASASDPAATFAGKTAAEAVSVLADLLGQCSERRAELARYADDARSAGELCERSYDALTVTGPVQ